MGWNFQHTYKQLPKRFYTEVKPTPVEQPALILMNESLAAELGLNVEELKKLRNVEIFAGNKLQEGSEPIAQAYAGHQFGHLTMLGDGRAILLGELITPNGERKDIQLKGAGRTPYSRGGDGRATLGPMLREYIISEGMHGLGIPTTRSLAVVKTGEDVLRDEELPGAILTRIANSHLRVGTFEYALRIGEIQSLADYAILRHDPDIANEKEKYRLFLRNVIDRQAALIAKWQLVGFVHGVMNTDNMTISGETIDYGPCAFMDTFNVETVFSSIDYYGRYAYGNQPAIAKWNLVKLAEALLPLLHEIEEKAIEIGEEELVQFAPRYEQYWLEGMRGKLGLFHKESGDDKLIQGLLDLMGKHKADYTNTFRGLTLHTCEPGGLWMEPDFIEWKKQWKQRVEKQDQGMEQVEEQMRQLNPSIIPRNHRVEEAIQKAVEDGDYTLVNQLVSVLQNPFSYSKEQTMYTTLPQVTSTPYRTFCGT